MTYSLRKPWQLIPSVKWKWMKRAHRHQDMKEKHTTFAAPHAKICLKKILLNTSKEIKISKLFVGSNQIPRFSVISAGVYFLEPLGGISGNIDYFIF